MPRSGCSALHGVHPNFLKIYIYIKHQPKFETKNVNWDNWQKHLTPHLSNYIDNFPDVITEDEIEKQTNL